MIYRFSLVFGALISGSVLADIMDDDDFWNDNFEITQSQTTQTPTPAAPKSSPPVQVKSSKTQSASKPRHNHYYLGAEALIFNSGLNNLEFGDRVDFANDIESHHLGSLPRPYNVGVRGWLGANFGNIGWGLLASGLHFSNYQSKTYHASNNPADYLLYLTYSSNLNPAKPQISSGGSQEGSYGVNLNIGDFLMTKSFMSQKHYEFMMDTGFRYVNLHQRFNVVNSNINPGTLVNAIKNSEKLSAYGLLLRLHNKFLFTKRFYIDLQAAGSLVYGQQLMKNSAIDGVSAGLLDPFIGSSFKQYNKKIQPIIEFEAKFGYQHSFFNDKFAFKITGGYYVMDFINGFDGIKIAYTQLLDIDNEVQTTSRFSADTVIQGATAGLEFTF